MMRIAYSIIKIERNTSLARVPLDSCIAESTIFHEIRYSRDGLKDETPMVPVYIQDLPYKAKDLSFSDASFDTKDSVIKGVNINEVQTPREIIASWYDTVPVTVLKAAGLLRQKHLHCKSIILMALPIHKRCSLLASHLDNK